MSVDIYVSRFDLAEPRSDAGPGARRLLGTATLELGGVFAVHNVKLIRLDSRLIVAFPDRIETVLCGWCGHKSPSGSHYCTHCGTAFPVALTEACVRHDVCHPIHPSARLAIERVVIAAWFAALETGAREARAMVGTNVNGRAG